MKLKLIATSTMGLESVLKKELIALGYKNTQTLNGKVIFDGDLSDICRCNLWLRTAGRIYVRIDTFTATCFNALYEQTKELPWENWIQKEDQFPVTKVSSKKSVPFSKSDCQRIVKKAIVDRLRTHYKVTTLSEKRALIAIRVQIEDDVVTLSIDSTGDGLNKRGYRSHMHATPLRETLAAGLILLSRWRPESQVLLDPFCGTGTILIEAGLIAKNIAPGLFRSFASQSWACIPKKVWETHRNNAELAIKKDANYQIYGSDIHSKTLSIARKNTTLAHLENIHVQRLDARELNSRFDTGKIICNPPYGSRLSEEADTEALYADIGDVFLNRFKNWGYYILSSYENFESLFGKKSTKHRKLYNGGMKCFYYQYWE